MLRNKLRFDHKIIQYVLKNNLHVEYFIWCYLRYQDFPLCSGVVPIYTLNNLNFCQSMLKKHLKTNEFFKVHGDKIYLQSKKHYMNYNCTIKELNKMARREIPDQLIKNKSSKWAKSVQYKAINKWDDTSIKYFLIRIFACKYGVKKPYALKLIAADLDYCERTIKRALNLYVDKHCRVQGHYSSRSHYSKGLLINYSPNYYTLQFGKTIV